MMQTKIKGAGEVMPSTSSALQLSPFPRHLIPYEPRKTNKNKIIHGTKSIVPYNTLHYNIIHKKNTKNMKVSNTKTSRAKQNKKHGKI